MNLYFELILFVGYNIQQNPRYKRVNIQQNPRYKRILVHLKSVLKSFSFFLVCKLSILT